MSRVTGGGIYSILPTKEGDLKHDFLIPSWSILEEEEEHPLQYCPINAILATSIMVDPQTSDSHPALIDAYCQTEFKEYKYF